MLAIVEESSVIYRYIFNSFVWIGYFLVDAWHGVDVQSKGHSWITETAIVAYIIVKVGKGEGRNG